MIDRNEAGKLMERTWLTGATILAQHLGCEPTTMQIELLKLYREQEYTVSAAVRAVFHKRKPGSVLVIPIKEANNAV